jgi:hypothetical protein
MCRVITILNCFVVFQQRVCHNCTPWQDVSPENRSDSCSLVCMCSGMWKESAPFEVSALLSPTVRLSDHVNTVVRSLACVSSFAIRQSQGHSKSVVDSEKEDNSAVLSSSLELACAISFEVVVDASYAWRSNYA